jgi:hypothetical protein
VRVVLWIFISLLAGSANAARAQNSAQTSDEVIVRGKRLSEFRVEVELARVRAYEIFNEINSTDDFDIQCVDEPRRGSRMGRRVRAARFEGRVSAAAAKDYLAMIRAICPDAEGLTQQCLFDPGLGSRGTAAARGAESDAPNQRGRLEEEIERLARTDLRFGQAILDFYDAGLKYEEERARARTKARPLGRCPPPTVAVSDVLRPPRVAA